MALQLPDTILALVQHLVHQLVALFVEFVEALDPVPIDTHLVTASLPPQIKSDVLQLLGIEAQLLG